jgi:glutathione synthase/RimK-type ligase-like ATP-grasp enzyme
MHSAALFKSSERFDSFNKSLINHKIDTQILDFDRQEWLTFDYSKIDFVIYYPSFEFSSNSPQALQKVYDNLIFLKDSWPHLRIFPDPKGIKYYNDKYRQFLFLQRNNFPIPKTIPLFSQNCVDEADKKLGYPLILKNRYGAGGGAVFRINNKNELFAFYRLSELDLVHHGALKYYFKIFTEKLFYWELFKAKKARYPFFSKPLLAQKFVPISRDLKTVVNKDKVVEAHWRYQADKTMWKMNIDGGGTGVWGYVPDNAINLSIQLTQKIGVSWLNLDLIESSGEFLISEFSPVWHHYHYKEKPSFVYKDDYNIDMPLEISLDLEKIIVESLIRSVKNE